MNTIKSASVNIDDLIIDPRTQRTLDTRRTETMAGRFDENAIGAITISQRADGTRIILDGQHRIAAARLAGYKGNFNALIHIGLTLPQEAQMFLDLNSTKEVSALAKFLVRITAEDPVANDINRIIKGYGWTVRNGGKTGNLDSVVAFERVYLLGGTNGCFLVDRVLKTITEAWGHDHAGVNGSIVYGLGMLFNKYGHDLTTDKLVREMQDNTPRTLLGKARAYQDAVKVTLPYAAASILHGLYNRKLHKNALPEWK